MVEPPGEFHLFLGAKVTNESLSLLLETGGETCKSAKDCASQFSCKGGEVVSWTSGEVGQKI